MKPVPLIATIALALLFMLALWYPALAQQNHDAMHWWYKGLRSNLGGSCCSNQDCGQTNFRTHEGKLQVVIHDRWCDVDENKILKGVVAPDKGTHVCAPVAPIPSVPCMHFCVVIGTGM